MERKNQKQILVLKKIALELASTNSHILEQDTCHCESICYRATLRFTISLNETFSKPGFIRVMKKLMKVLSYTFYKSLVPFNMLTVKGCSETVFFRELFNQVFDSL